MFSPMKMKKIQIAIVSLALGSVLTLDAAQAVHTAVKPVAPKSVKAIVPVAPVKAAPAKVAAVKTAPVKAGPAKPASKQIVRVATRSRRRGAVAPRAVVIPRQGQPTKERYIEIQQALIEKGYFAGEASGDWNAQSAEALKRFQSEQSITASGRLNSLSLIALGLGPKRNPMGALPVIKGPVAGPEAPEAEQEPVELPPAPAVDVQQ